MKRFALLALLVFCGALAASSQTFAPEVEKLVERANRLSLENKTDEAIAVVGEALAIDPQNADLYALRAHFYSFADDRKAQVLADAQKAAALAPTDRRVLYAAAQTLKASFQPAEALKIADQLVALGAVDRFAWSLRIHLKMQLGDFVGAYEDTAVALEQYPGENMFRQPQAAILRLTGDPEKALEIYDAVIAANEKKFARVKNEGEKEALARELTGFLFSRAGYHISKANFDKARADLLKAVEYAPTDGNYYLRAKYYREMKMCPEAIADLTKALAALKSFDRVQILLERGDVYAESRRYDEALADFAEVLKTEPELKDAYDARVRWVTQLRAKDPTQPK